MANRGQLTPTNLSEYEGQHGRRTSPSASVVDGHTRYSMGDVGSDVYNYNTNYGQDPAYYGKDANYYGTQTRLSIPMDNSQVNPGYEPSSDPMRFPSTGSYNAPGSTGYNTGTISSYNQSDADQMYNNAAAAPLDQNNTFTNQTTNPTATDEVPLH